MEIKIIKRRIKHCIDLIYENDNDLFDRANFEITISAKLAQYLFIEFKEFDVDCEYDKHINNKKRVENLDSNIRPDIIIHKRGKDDNNLVYIEVKKEQNKTNRNKDLKKIIEMTKLDGEYRYKLGIFIDFHKNKDRTIVKYFINGEEK
jgi:hypothetical protein